MLKICSITGLTSMITKAFYSFQAGNNYEGEYDELKYVMKSVMVIKLNVAEPKIIFEPAFREIKDVILRCFQNAINASESLPRVRNSSQMVTYSVRSMTCNAEAV